MPVAPVNQKQVAELPVCVRIGNERTQGNLGIHVHKPTEDELKLAIRRAAKDRANKEMVYVYDADEDIQTRIEREIPVSEFLQHVNLTLEYVQVHSRTDINEWVEGSAHWDCTIRSNEGMGEFHLFYSKGPAHRRWKLDAKKYRYGLPLIPSELADIKPGERVQQKYFRSTLHLEALRAELSEPTPPSLRELLECLASDASLYDDARDFDDWCSSLGVDSDSRRWLATYQLIAEQAKKLRYLLGNESYERLKHLEF